MASSYSSRLRFELPATGEQSGSWGITMNSFMGSLLEDAIAGNLSKTMPDADYTLTTATGSTDEARNQGVSLTGALTAPRNLIVPTQQRHFQVFNGTNQTVTVKTAAGAGAALAAGTVARLWCDGAGIYFASIPVAPNTGAPLTLALPSLSVSGATSLGTTPSATTPLTVISSTAGFNLDLRGRAADGIGILRFMNNAGTVELARLQSGAAVGTLALALGATGAVSVFTTDTAGNIAFQHAANVGAGLTVGNGLVVSTGGASINGNVTLAGDITAYRPASPGTGAIFLNQVGSRYIFYDGTNYNMPGGGLLLNGSSVWTAAAFNPANYATLASPVFNGVVYNNSGRIVSFNTANNPSLTVYDAAQGSAVGLMLGSGNTTYLAGMDSAGNYAGFYRWYADSAGNFAAAGNVTALSDMTLKTDFRPLEGAAAAVDRLAEAVSWYRWLDRPDQRLQLGFLAQRVQSGLPVAVDQGPDGHLTVADRPILAAVVVALAQAQARIAALEAKLHG